MSLKYKISLIIVGIFIISGLANYAIQQFIIFPSYINLELDEAKKDLQRSEKALKREIFHLSNLCRDWAAWDDTYDFVISQSEDYIKSNLILSSFTDNELNLIYILDTDGRVVWGEIHDIETGEIQELSDFPKDILHKPHPLIPSKIDNNKLSEMKISGIFMTEKGPMLVSSRPILTSNDEGPVRGFFIMGRLLNEEIIKGLIEQTEVNFQIFPIKDITLPKIIKEIPDQITKVSESYIEKDGVNNLLIYSIYPDVENRPCILIKVKVPRIITSRGKATLKYATIAIILLAIIITIFILLFLQKIILRPIKDLTNHTLKIRKTGNISKKLYTKRQDEIGTLIRNFNSMLSTLELKNSELIKVNKELRDDIAAREKAEKALEESEEKNNRLKRMEALGLLAGGVAHDLNNILSGIILYPDLLLTGNDFSEKQRKIIKSIQLSGERAAAVVADLLTVAQGVATSTEVMSVNYIITDYINSPEHQRFIQSHPNVIVETILDQNLFMIKGSPAHISKIVMNLVFNAAEAIKNDGVITISTKNQYLDRNLKGYDDIVIGEYVILSVSDNGSGIPQKDLGRIFEPFYSRKILGRSGTGLGLTIVWNTVHNHNGYIDVETSNKGTTFRAYFPITRDTSVAEKQYVTIDDLKGDGQKILVVDDEELQREIASEMLVQLKYEVEAVASGEEAIKYLKNHHVDLILLDMIMDPGINGLETYGTIIKDHPGQKAIIASGFSETDEVKEALRLGVSQYIQKPYSLHKIAHSIKNIFDSKINE